MLALTSACAGSDLETTGLHFTVLDGASGATAPRVDHGSQEPFWPGRPDPGGGNADTGEQPKNDCDLRPGTQGCPCGENADCISGWCAPNPSEGKAGVCTETCILDCGDGYACKAVGGTEPDIVYLCVPTAFDLCAPCETDYECGGAKDSCVDTPGGEGGRCGTACDPASEGSCPPGYRCSRSEPRGGGEPADQCVPVSGDCSCTLGDAGVERICKRENAHGTCSGTQICEGDAGWGACSATEPAVDLCDGFDDDCDGVTDDAFTPDTCHRVSAHGSCQGKTVCDGEGGIVCEAPEAQEEICNLHDDDCDGEVDEGFPDNDGDGVKDCLIVDSDGDGDPDNRDCAPADPAVHHAAEERCNGRDDNCVGGIDEHFGDNDGDGLKDCVDHDDDDDGVIDAADNCPLVPNGDQSDRDRDGTGDACEEDDDGDGDPDASDCAPADPTIHHGAEERCDGIDRDCDGSTDEPGSTGCSTRYRDADGDGFGDPAWSMCLCQPAEPYLAPEGNDCNDGMPGVHPGAEERCNTIDDDCDGVVDPEDALGCSPFYEDTDGDGHGREGSSPACLCAAGESHPVRSAEDCDDSAASVHPGAGEVCNGIDDDCDGVADPQGSQGCLDWHRDADGDGFGDPASTLCLCHPEAPYTAEDGSDCSDSMTDVHPGATERCNTIDDDCDGAVDPANAIGCTPFYEDADGDGHGREGSAPACLCAVEGLYRVASAEDCDDSTPAVHPGVTEACNGVDDDCDGIADPQGSKGCVSWLHDGDGDGYGEAGKLRCLCGPEAPWSAREVDCDDEDGSIHPGAAESCNGTDDDCDGVTDPPDAAGCATRFADADHDGYGDASTGLCLCSAVITHPVDRGGDCDDASGEVHPEAVEACNGVDDNCDGETDEGAALGCAMAWPDEDEDGFGAAGAGACVCEPPPGTAPLGGDCDDGDRGVRPGVLEPCAGAADCCLSGSVCTHGLCMPEPPSCETQECLGDRLCVAGSCIPHAAGTVPESDGACVRPFVPGVFSPTIRCEWSGPPAGDPFPAYNHLIATPVVADLDLDGDPSAVRPSILVPTAASGCDTPNSKGGGVIRVIDGATCAQQATLPGTVTAAAALAVADLDLDGRPEVVAVNPSGGPRAYRYDEASATWAVMWNATKAGGGASKPYANSWRYAGCSIVQVRPDPAPEVMLGGVLYDANGREVATNLQNKNVAQGLRTPVVADVDSDGEGELVTGDGVWRLDDARGRFVKESWFRGTGSDGFVALADFGSFPVAGLGEPLPEVVVVQGGKVRVQDLSGRAVFGPYNLPLIPPAPDRGHGGPPTVADFDGDGRPEAALAGRGAYAVFDLDCAGDPAPFGCWGPGILWAMPSQDYSSSVTGSSIFDFEGDGIAEGIYADECYVRVYHGNTGEVLFSQARQSGTWYENPIIADANGDHRTEIVQGSNELCGVRCPALDPYFRGLRCTEPEDCASGECATGYCRCTNDAGCGGLQSGYTCTNPLPNTPGDGKVCRAHHQGSYRWLRVYGDARDAWVDSRPIWHQHTYFLANVLDDGTVPPADAHRPWAVPSYNAFRQNRQTGDPRAAADLTVRILYAGNCDPEGYLSVHAEVCNRGAAPAPRGAPLAFFDGLPGFGARVLCLHETSADLFGGDCEQHSCTFRLEDPEVQHTIAVSADHGPGLGAVRECRESNNGDLLDGVTCENQR